MITLANLKKMPKSCNECPFGGCGCKILGNDKRIYLCYDTIRRSDCPLREVKEPFLTDEEILDAIFCDFCGHIDGGESNLRGVNDIDFVIPDWNHDMNSSIKVSFTDGSSLVYCRNSNEV